MTLLREQIDVLLENMEATTWRRHREDPGDPALARDLVAQTRALLRTVELQHHLRICDHVQRLLLGLECPGEPGAAPPPGEPAILRAASTRGWVPNLGIALVDDPFDLDAYGGDEAGEVAMPGDAASDDPAPQRPARPTRERRQDRLEVDVDLRAGLTARQLATLDTMALFGWTLEFVRRPMFHPPQPVAFDRNRQRFVVVDPDGKAEEDPTVQLRS